MNMYFFTDCLPKSATYINGKSISKDFFMNQKYMHQFDSVYMYICSILPAIYKSFLKIVFEITVFLQQNLFNIEFFFVKLQLYSFHCKNARFVYMHCILVVHCKKIQFYKRVVLRIILNFNRLLVAWMLPCRELRTCNFYSHKYIKHFYLRILR